MQTLLLTMGLFGTVTLGLAIGVIFRRPKLRGTCGGTGESCACDAAGKPRACEMDEDEADPA